jgi:HEPN domain-containing protein
VGSDDSQSIRLATYGRAMTTSQAGDSGTDFGPNVIQQVFELWVLPEVQRRGLTLTRADINKVVVEMAPSEPVRVLINDEAAIVSAVRAKRAIEPGEAVTLDDIDEIADLKPHDIDENSGWICFLRWGGAEYVAFDFVYNRARAKVLLERARSFLRSADRDGEAELAVALDNAHSAAELSVQAYMLCMQEEPRRRRERREWLAKWAELKNAPQEHDDMLWNLADLRDQARYGDEAPTLKPGRFAKIIKTVASMIESTEAHVTRLDPGS